MKYLDRLIVGVALSALMSGNAIALGLGNVVGQAVLGLPLRVEIALIGSDAGIPAVDCFSLRRPKSEISSNFVLRNAQFQIVEDGGRAMLVVTSASPVQEPVLEFAIAVGCGFELAKDYLLLADEPVKLASATAASVQSPIAPRDSPNSAPMQARQVSPVPPSASVGGHQSYNGNTPTLSALARQKYPLQPKAREKFTRMMLLANPQLQSDESVIESVATLKTPPGLPLQRTGPPLSAPRSGASEAKIPKPPVESPAVSTPTPAAGAPKRDLLILGAPSEQKRNPSELLAEAERLAAILLEQNKTQDAIADQIGKLDNTLVELKKSFISVTDRLNRIEVERQQEKLAAKPASLDFLELVLAVLAGGLIGALSLYGFNRWQSRRSTSAEPASTSTSATAVRPVATKPATKELEDFNLPWTRAEAVDDAKLNAAPVAKPAESNAAAEIEQHDFDFSTSAVQPSQNDRHDLAAPPTGRTSR